jgi:sterol 3beta-glucosyltransferase
MHLVIVTSGSRGDVQPYLALAVRAQRDGHRVTLATHVLFESWVRSHGVAFRPLHGDPAAMLAAPGGRAWLADGSLAGLWQFAQEFRRDFGGLLRGLLTDMTAATVDADVVVYNAVCQAAAQLCRVRGTPSVAGFLQPLTPTRAFPASGLPYRAPRSAWEGRRNHFSHVVGEQLLWQPARPIVNAWLTRELRAAALPWRGPFRERRSPRFPICYAYSPAVLPAPADWPMYIRCTGYWFLDAPSYTAPPALDAFLSAGDAPVTVGFGSMTPQDGEWLTRLVLDACERAACRVLLLQGWGSLGATALPSWAHAESDVPHAWLYPRSSAIIHHGGAGTTGAAVRSGTPSLAVPLGFDQLFWGTRLEALGVSPAPIKRRDLTVDGLAAALRRMRTDAAMRDAAAALGGAVRAEDGVSEALHCIEAHAHAGAGTTDAR